MANADKNEDQKNHIREGQEDSAISRKDHIKNEPYPGHDKRDKQHQNQEEFITPPVTHPGEDANESV